MTWPGWGDIMPTLTLVATIAGLMWVVVRLVVVPVADRAASEAEKRAAEKTQVAVDGLYERLKGNDFRHVYEALATMGDRITEVREDFGGRLGRMDRRIGERLDGVDRRLDGMDHRLDAVRKDFSERIEGVRQEFGERFERARQDRKDMEARLMDAILGRVGAE